MTLKFKRGRHETVARDGFLSVCLRAPPCCPWMYLRLVSISTTDVTTKPLRDCVVTAVSLRNCRPPREPAVSQSRPPANTTVLGTAPRIHTHVELIQTARVVHRVVAGP